MNAGGGGGAGCQGASRQLARYFAGAHSAVSVHPPGAPFAQARLWTLGTEKADMNHYFDKLAKQTESHVREIRNLHRAGRRERKERA